MILEILVLGLMFAGGSLFGDCQVTKGEISNTGCSAEKPCTMKDGLSQDKKYLCTNKTPRLRVVEQEAPSINSEKKIYECDATLNTNIESKENNPIPVSKDTRIGNFLCSEQGWGEIKRVLKFDGATKEGRPALIDINTEYYDKAAEFLNDSLKKPLNKQCANLGLSILKKLHPVLFKKEKLSSNDGEILNKKTINSENINEYISLFRIVFIMSNAGRQGKDYSSFLDVTELSGFQSYQKLDFKTFKTEAENLGCMKAESIEGILWEKFPFVDIKTNTIDQKKTMGIIKNYCLQSINTAVKSKNWYQKINPLAGSGSKFCKEKARKSELEAQKLISTDPLSVGKILEKYEECFIHAYSSNTDERCYDNSYHRIKCENNNKGKSCYNALENNGQRKKRIYKVPEKNHIYKVYDSQGKLTDQEISFSIPDIFTDKK